MVHALQWWVLGKILRKDWHPTFKVIGPAGPFWLLENAPTSIQTSYKLQFFSLKTYNKLIYICLDLKKGIYRNFKCILTIWPFRWIRSSWKSLVRACSWQKRQICNEMNKIWKHRNNNLSVSQTMRLIARCPTKTDLNSTFLDPTIGCLRQNHFN